MLRTPVPNLFSSMLSIPYGVLIFSEVADLFSCMFSDTYEAIFLSWPAVAHYLSVMAHYLGVVAHH
jgi:hypothetical protein